MQENVNEKAIWHCPNCGARVVGEICEYCGSNTGIETMNATLLYPEFRAKDFTDGSQGKYFIVFGAFWEGVTTVVMSVFLGFAFFDDFPFMLVRLALFFLLFHAIGLIMSGIGIYMTLRRGDILHRGETLEATCNGFTPTSVKWLTEIDGEPRFIFTHRKESYREYQIGWKITIKRIDNDICLLEDSLRTK